MGIEVHEKQIGDHTFMITNLPVKKVIKLLPLVVEAVGSAFSAANTEDATVDAALLGKAAVALASSLEEEKLDRLVAAMASSTKVKMADADGQVRLKDLSSEFVQNQLFVGNMSAFLQWMKFSLEVNFASFFDGEAFEEMTGGLAKT